MIREITATCKFCGQSAIIEVQDSDIILYKDQEELKGLPEYKVAEKVAIDKATRQCGCEESNKFKKQEIRRNFEGFAASDLVNFMELHKLEEIQVTDAFGNKVKLKKKESGIIDVTKTLKDVM